MIVIVLLILILFSDILTLKDILSRDMDGSMKVFWSIVVLVIPVIGMSIYYFTKR